MATRNREMRILLIISCHRQFTGCSMDKQNNFAFCYRSSVYALEGHGVWFLVRKTRSNFYRLFLNGFRARFQMSFLRKTKPIEWKRLTVLPFLSFRHLGRQTNPLLVCSFTVDPSLQRLLRHFRGRKGRHWDYLSRPAMWHTLPTKFTYGLSSVLYARPATWPVPYFKQPQNLQNLPQFTAESIHCVFRIVGNLRRLEKLTIFRKIDQSPLEKYSMNSFRLKTIFEKFRRLNITTG